MLSLNLDLLLLVHVDLHVPLEETSRNLSGGKNTDDGQNLRAKNYERAGRQVHSFISAFSVQRLMQSAVEGGEASSGTYPTPQRKAMSPPNGLNFVSAEEVSPPPDRRPIV